MKTRPRPPVRRDTGLPAHYRLQSFAFEYLKDGNATRAARRVGYSAKTASQQGSILLRNPKVQRIIAKKLKDADATAERVLLELRRLAVVDITQCFDQDQNLKPFAIWTPPQRAALASYEVIKKNAAAGDGEVDIVHKVKFWNKNQALELLMKHHGLLQGEMGGSEPDVPTFIMPEGTRVEIE